MKYEAPEMEILYLEAEDVITVSNNGLYEEGTTNDGNSTGTNW